MKTIFITDDERDALEYIWGGLGDGDASDALERVIERARGGDPIWVVGGRFLFDDEDTVIEVRAADWDAAHEAWAYHMREEDPENENDLVSNVCLGPYKGA